MGRRGRESRRQEWSSIQNILQEMFILVCRELGRARRHNGVRGRYVCSGVGSGRGGQFNDFCRAKQQDEVQGKGDTEPTSQHLNAHVESAYAVPCLKTFPQYSSPSLACHPELSP